MFQPSGHNDKVWFQSCLSNQDLLNKLKNIKLIVSDVDGALTNAWVYYDQAGEGGRSFSTVDGYIVKPALTAGLLIALLSGKNNPSTIARGKHLGIPDELLIAGTGDKRVNIKNLLQKQNILAHQTLIFGDDFLDAQVKLDNQDIIYACPTNTPFYLQHVADLIVPRAGGHNAFRLLLDAILYAQGKHIAQTVIETALAQ